MTPFIFVHNRTMNIYKRSIGTTNERGLVSYYNFHNSSDGTYIDNNVLYLHKELKRRSDETPAAVGL